MNADKPDINLDKDGVPTGRPSAKPDSMLDRLRRTRKEIADSRETELEIPGYDGLLVARYKLLDSKEISGFAHKVRKQPADRQNVLVTADTLAASCVGFLVRENGELRPLGHEQDDPVCYDDRLASYLGYEANSAREAVLGLFGDNEISMLRHGADLGDWFSDTRSSVDEEFSGN